MTTRPPASPNSFLRMIRSMASRASAGAVADGDAFALGQTRRLHHHRLSRSPHIFLGRLRVGKRPRLGGRDRLLAHQFLGEPLVRLDAGGCFRRAEDLHARCARRSAKPRRQRVFGADDDQADAVLRTNFSILSNSIAPIGHVVGDLRRAGVARGGEEGRHPRGIRQFPSQGVLALAVSDEQDFHALGYSADFRTTETRAGTARRGKSSIRIERIEGLSAS